MKKTFTLLLLAVVALPAVAALNARDRSLKASHTLSVPVVNPATDVTDAGFTANWESVGEANGYMVYTYIRHKAPADEQYYFCNEDFSGFKYGSIDSPFDLGYGWLDGYMARTNWYVYGAYSCNGVLGLYNDKTATTKGMLMSPMYDLKNANGKATVSFRARTTGTATVAVYATEYLMAGQSYALGTVAKASLTTDWADYSLEIDGGVQGCYIEIDMVDGTDNAYFDSLTIAQQLAEGDETMLVYDYRETDNVTSVRISTPDKVAGDVYWYQVAAMKTLSNGQLVNDSEYSELMEVKGNGAVADVTVDGAAVMAVDGGILVSNPQHQGVAVYALDGRLVHADNSDAESQSIALSRGVYAVRIGAQTFKIACTR